MKDPPQEIRFIHDQEWASTVCNLLVAPDSIPRPHLRYRWIMHILDPGPIQIAKVRSIWKAQIVVMTLRLWISRICRPEFRSNFLGHLPHSGNLIFLH